jgi:RNA polymerase subunit RPABC4/transcription elongation factor Spt4
MFLMIGITQGSKDLEHHQTTVCPACGRYGRYEVFMTFTQLLLFFIPCFKWNRQYFVRMACCGALYTLDPEVGARIARGEDVEIRPEDLMRVQQAETGYGGYGGGRSGQSYYEQSGYGRRPADDSFSSDAGNAGTNEAGDPPAKIRRRCVICGYETDEDFAYCPKCGQRF